ncbi:ABC transporter ATP-binding protein [Acidaminobacter sp. JC074]|uniref:ABC transporter ATP-binding protein n=1 Tax=Acidaminobacter sp. JC074 TaxID=2530199 RepID=UPI001F0DEFAF|nr:ABC transporter ATP-binding protein [Acidaminobacter sp. JC074]MCH4886351.1 ABC transporter ATP-binding protein [Acidaminobacter sp. JC074]
MKDVILDVSDLAFSFKIYGGEVQAVRGVDFKIEKGETLGIVGESGSGKSVTAKTIVGLNAIGTSGYLKSGSILFDGKDLTKLSKKEMSQVRAKDIRMIFQDPMTSLNPTMKVGRQIQEGLIKAGYPKDKAKTASIEMLRKVRLPNPEKRYNQYPHEFSGGMRQRAMIALAMAVNPKILIADEPTTALDVTTQAQILDLMKDIQKEFDATIIMITHDLGVVAGMAKNIAVMYAGKIVEYGYVDDIFEKPAHPYTWGLLKSVPDLEKSHKEPLSSIMGSPPDLFSPPKGCGFADRCEYAMKICHMEYPETTLLKNGHKVSCFLQNPNAMSVVNPITGLEVKHG